MFYFRIKNTPAESHRFATCEFFKHSREPWKKKWGNFPLQLMGWWSSVLKINSVLETSSATAGRQRPVLNDRKSSIKSYERITCDNSLYEFSQGKQNGNAEQKHKEEKGKPNTVQKDNSVRDVAAVLWNKTFPGCFAQRRDLCALG